MKIRMDKITLRSKICLSIALTIMGAFFLVQSLLVFKVFKPSYNFALFGYACVMAFSLPFFSFVKEFLDMVFSKEKELLEEVMTKNTYLEHAAKILRHDMHSGINTYIPRGVRSLKRRLSEEDIKKLKLEAPLKLISEGLEHSQQVYKGVFEFTNLVREEATMQLEPVDLSEILRAYLKRTSYSDQVVIERLVNIPVNESLFCTAMDNLIRNGLKYNDSPTKMVVIRMLDDNTIGVIDNGRGMSPKEFEELSKPYKRKKDQKEGGTGLGLNICLAIFKEHGFEVSVDDIPKGTRIRIKIR